MSIKYYSNKSFNKLLEKACKGTSVSTKELLRELVSIGYRNFRDLDLTIEDLRMIVSDIEDSKEISTLYSHPSGSSRPEAEVAD